MWNGLVLFDRSGPGCTHQLLLVHLRGGSAEPVAGATAGADLNDRHAVWLAGGALIDRGVSSAGELSPDTTTLKPAEGDVFRAPITVEGDHVYFVHDQGGQFFIARAKLPLDGSEVEHYVAREGDRGSEESPHFGVTGDTLYYTDYPQPDGKPGSEKIIVRVPNATDKFD